MIAISRTVPELRPSSPEHIPELLRQHNTPLVMRGLIKHWPAVQRSASVTEACAYLRQFYQDSTVTVFRADASQKGRYFYNENLSGFNYAQSRERLDSLLDELQQASNTDAPGIYVGSTTIERCLPGFLAHNPLDFGQPEALASIWLGNQSRIAAHYDVPDNLACVVAGTRRFTLFPPEQIANLYIGPLDLTPAGQAISLVDFHHPDEERFPKFKYALEQAMTATLAPGDALFIPSMWWHHVEGLDAFNVLVNYWWRNTPAWMGPPINALLHAMLAIRELPAAQRDAWRAQFEHYVFADQSAQHQHIPESARGVLQALDDNSARQLRSQLLNRLNR
ncbi:cupin-like domain-containing protein [Permianibacter aggregans]|nr:cupin-like domain-containing protein [Permianibacter aggregans]QGX41544.1 cupin-like domain-containing protein [Permianibacter aggregans]